jgi:hypothetical protein
MHVWTHLSDKWEGKSDAELVVLPEALIPCYSVWTSTADALVAGPELYVRLCEQAVERDSETIAQLQQAARDAGAIVACGIGMSVLLSIVIGVDVDHFERMQRVT